MHVKETDVVFLFFGGVDCSCGRKMLRACGLLSKGFGAVDTSRNAKERPVGVCWHAISLALNAVLKLFLVAMVRWYAIGFAAFRFRSPDVEKSGSCPHHRRTMLSQWTHLVSPAERYFAARMRLDVAVAVCRGPRSPRV